MHGLHARWNGPTGAVVNSPDLGDPRDADAQRVEHLALAAIRDSLVAPRGRRGTVDSSGTATGSNTSEKE